MKRTSKKVAVIGTFSALSLLGMGTAQATGGSYGDYDNRGDRFRAVSYINPDTGAATANPDVNADSDCFSPDRYDNQQFSPAGTATKNVHNDACFLDKQGNKVGKGIGATFQLRGVGFINACPDPDGAGPETAKLADTNGDGKMDRCTQSSYQDKGVVGKDDVDGDFEYHARINNNDAMAGKSKVRWGLDRDLNGLDGRHGNSDKIKVSWSADGKKDADYGKARTR